MAVNDALAGTHKIIEEAKEQQGGQLVPTLNDFSQ